jgi:hypothetical protein
MNLLSLSYDDLAQQMGIAVKPGRGRENRSRPSRLRDHDGAAGATVPPAEIIRPVPATKAVTVFTGQPAKPVTDQVRRLEARITVLSNQVADLQDRLGAAERLAHDEQYKLVQERKKSAQLMTQVQKLSARLRRIQQAEPVERPRPWWRRLLSPEYL